MCTIIHTYGHIFSEIHFSLQYVLKILFVRLLFQGDENTIINLLAGSLFLHLFCLFLGRTFDFQIIISSIDFISPTFLSIFWSSLLFFIWLLPLSLLFRQLPVISTQYIFEHSTRSVSFLPFQTVLALVFLGIG